MKFLIQDYSTSFHTEPKYFNHILNNIEGCSSVLWNNNDSISTYDMVDIVEPNVIISHAAVVQKDLIIYLSENKNIELILNISGINKEQLKNIENIFEIYNINCNLCLINYSENYITSKFNIVSIYHGVDLFLSEDNNLQYNIDKLYLAYNNADINDTCSYHVISHNKEIENKVDLLSSVYDLGKIYNNYDKIHIGEFTAENIIPQSFFDACYYGKSFVFDGTLNQLSEICRILKVDNIKDTNKIKQIIKEKHTCFNRTKSLLSQLKCTDLVTKLSNIMKEVI